MNCNCCPSQTQFKGIYINELQSTKQQTNKTKFSFRTTRDNSYYQYAKSLHKMPIESNINAEDSQLLQLQLQYRRLRQEQDAITQFQERRIGGLLNDIIKYEIQIGKRDRQIEQLQNLFKIKMQQKRLIQQQQQQQQRLHQQFLTKPYSFNQPLPQFQNQYIPIQTKQQPNIRFSQVQQL